MKLKLHVNHKRTISTTKEKLLSYLWDLNHMPAYESKVDSIKVQPETEKNGSYKVVGRFLGPKWFGKFSYSLNPSGFHSSSLNLPSGVQVNGGFVVTSVSPEVCSLHHYEIYQLPFYMLPLYPFLKLYLAGTLQDELKVIERSV